MRVAITGASGFIGANLVHAFRAAGSDVEALTRRSGFRLGETFTATGDVLVHCAHEWRPRFATFNVEASAKLFEEARANGFSRIVFVSSLAARSDSHSNYGREKYIIESFLNPAVDAIVRPGLVVGDGGLFRSMYQSIRRTGIAPIFQGGRQPVYTVGIDDLTAAILAIALRSGHGIYTVASTQPVMMRDLLVSIAKAQRRPLLLLPLPYRAVLALVEAAERARISLPITAETLRGLQNLVELEHSSDNELGLQFRPLNELLKGF